ncbi:MAG: HDOD domain-containing protein [Candidatus Auribacter fodinae]|jgi:putative nucleotidyltransferase with HDIG domain|uniref:HDOD domain-containing protein n=1 Tax=Candidatus Auribacter fodinae TaxID=2093366 RepID=A0A3A4QYN2_9BACT|nr:MAG: HDOD domain-containing protein [Candidatus Auribacter fodinae]
MEKNVHLKIISELGNIDALPTIPQVVLRLNGVLADPNSSARDVAKLLGEDQVITTRILKLVNSAFYGYARQVKTLTQAVVILGFREVKNIVLTSQIFDLFKSSHKNIRDLFDINQLWTHSVGCAVIAKNIGERIRYLEPEALFIAGLIHDIGKVVEINCIPDKMPDVFRTVQEENISMIEAEKKVLEVTHCEIGKVMAEMWDFPQLIEYVVAYHHKPSLSRKFEQEVAIVHVANCMVRMLEIGSGGDSLIPQIDPFSWERIGLDQDTHEEILTHSLEAISELLPVFQMS